MCRLLRMVRAISFISLTSEYVNMFLVYDVFPVKVKEYILVCVCVLCMNTAPSRCYNGAASLRIL